MAFRRKGAKAFVDAIFFCAAGCTLSGGAFRFGKKITNSEPITITITERRWKLLGHILRLPANCPARKAMKYFFEYRSAKKFLGRKRTTIITTLNKDIKRTKQKFPSFPVVPLISQVSLQNTYTKAKNRKLWLKIVKQVVDSAYS